MLASLGPTGPGAPVASRGDEVAVCRACLLLRRLAVTEQPSRLGAHLEEAEVLAVDGVRSHPGLAPRDAERLAAMRAEHAADHRLGHLCANGREPSDGLFSLRLGAMRSHLPLCRLEAAAVCCDLTPRLDGEAGVPEEPLVIREEAEHLTVSLRGLSRRRIPAHCGRRREGERSRDKQQNDGANAHP